MTTIQRYISCQFRADVRKLNKHIAVKLCTVLSCEKNPSLLGQTKLNLHFVRNLSTWKMESRLELGETDVFSLSCRLTSSQICCVCKVCRVATDV